MIDLLKSALKAQTVMTLLAVVLASALLAARLISPSEWRDVINASLLYFVGGGLLKEGAVAFAGRTQT